MHAHPASGAQAPARFRPAHPHSRLQDDWLYLHAQMPPAKWRALPSFGAAAAWLGMHDSLRRGQGRLEHLGRAYLNQRLDWPDYRRDMLCEADLHYSHLRGHHRNEDTEAFPRMRQQEPRLARGFDLLENDHQQLEQHLHAVDGWLAGLQGRAALTPDPALAEQLHTAVQTAGALLYRHLMDEEDLVIPLLALHSP
ncbi:MAG: hemerythrin domain-containing protein [Pseudomonadota bacterium]|nr:hemerythrin domain-containing protein [Pseudomonadota bacterium]